MAISIKAEKISKAYQLGDIGTGTISYDLARLWARIRGKEDPFLKVGETNDRTVKGKGNIVWSLQDISFEIQQGDAVGIIGKNGAGKSTLLKILSRVTSPTGGCITGQGRIASLLEVGTGFHPELTGRENIFLNGAIMGMRKKEIARKFDEIVEFAGVERYLDTPIKRYSSGMYVRLAFAVAAHLESEILIVDEVLAVGDAEFQKKCLGKMGEVSKGEGRTVLFVSHNMGMISTLCQKAVLLQNGNIQLYDKTETVLNKYIESTSQSGKFSIEPSAAARKVNYTKEIFTTTESGALNFDFRFDEHIYVHIHVVINEFIYGLQLLVALDGKYQHRIFTVLRPIENVEGNELKVVLKVPKNLIAPNFYTWAVGIWSTDGRDFDLVTQASPIQVHDSGTDFAVYEGSDYGAIIINSEWVK